VEKPCIAWRKSTASSTSGCVEVAAVGGWVLIRDSVRPDGVVLRLPLAAWSAFLPRACGKDPRRT
jgi:hypothetical protein